MGIAPHLHGLPDEAGHRGCVDFVGMTRPSIWQAFVSASKICSGLLAYLSIHQGSDYGGGACHNLTGNPAHGLLRSPLVTCSPWA